MHRARVLQRHLSTRVLGREALVSRASSSSSWPVPRIGDSVDDIDTPALVLDMDAFEHNISTLPSMLKSLGSKVAIRPHAKSHKCPDIVKRQVAAGAVGCCSAKLYEAVNLVKSGVKDVFITNQIIGRKKLEVFADLVKSYPETRIAITCDDEGNIHELAEVLGEVCPGKVVDTFVEVDVGHHRGGSQPGKPAAALCKLIADHDNLNFKGLHCYHGKCQHIRNWDKRKSEIDAACKRIEDTKNELAKLGLSAEIITGAGTGSFEFEGTSNVYNEVQCGSYVLMDGDYSDNFNKNGNRDSIFKHSMFVLSSICTRNDSWVICDSGLKCSSVDSGLPRSVDPDLKYVSASDEHGTIKVADGKSADRLNELKVGDKIWLIPGHCDPTVNMHDYFVCVRNNVVEDIWPIVGRGPGH